MLMPFSSNGCLAMPKGSTGSHEHGPADLEVFQFTTNTNGDLILALCSPECVDFPATGGDILVPHGGGKKIVATVLAAIDWCFRTSF